MKKMTLDKITSIFLQLLFFVFCVCFLTFLSHNSCIIWEDVSQIFFEKTRFMDLYREADHGCLISWVVMKWIGSFIPLTFNVHPNDNIFGDFFKATVISLLPLIISKFALLKKDTPKFSLFCYVTALVFFFIACCVTPAAYYQLVLYSKNLRYLFMMIFYLLFWLEFIKFFLSGKQITLNKTVYLSILAFIVGFSVEPINISTFFSLITFWIYYIFKRLKFNEKVSKFMFYVTGLFLLGLFLFYSSPNFWDIAAEERGFSSFSSIYSSITVNVFDFIKSWFQVVFVNGYRWFFSLTILFLSFCVLFFKKDTNDKKVVFASWVVILGVALFNFTLILAGRTYYDGSSFWLESIDLKASTMIVFLVPIFVLFGFLISKIEEDKPKKTLVLLIIFVFSLLAFLYFYNFGHQRLVAKAEYFKKTRLTMYKLEKLYVFYSLKKETAILPSSILDDYDMRFAFLGIIKEDFDKKDYSNEIYPSFTTYYKKIYKNNPVVKIKLTDDLSAMKKFSDAGGVFEPGEIEESKFSRLMDENFVLNKK